MKWKNFTFIWWKFLFPQDLRYIECYSRLENPEWNLCRRKGLIHKKHVVKSLSTLILYVFNWLSLIFSLPLYRVIKNAVMWRENNSIIWNLGHSAKILKTLIWIAWSRNLKWGLLWLIKLALGQLDNQSLPSLSSLLS